MPDHNVDADAAELFNELNRVVDADAVGLFNKLNRLSGFGLVPNEYKGKPWSLAYHCTHAYNPRHVPALKTKVEYIFGFGLADGIFVRVEDYIVLGAYRDAQPLLGCPTIP